jgi:UDP-N-acetylglucosamine--N-acetylmuramyl-(pentapeptide) pyrophosphoryl-undecaprenol N-acetylglucosamine transferase
MAEVYSKADLLVSRAGATTLTELAVLGKPAILVPYPHAADDHQTKNGAYYVDGGGAVQFIEKDLSSETLFHTIDELMKSGDRRTAMAEGMRRLAIPDAAEKIVDVCLQAATGTAGPAAACEGIEHVQKK